MNTYRDRITSAFADYTASYDASNPKIKLKIDHTYRVASLCEDIAHSLGLSDDDTDTAWTCGMLHDIGRFEQVKRWGTFFDSISVDHAQFGADLLFKEGLYEKIVPHDDDLKYSERKALVEKAIRLHNVFTLPENLDDRVKMFSQILRDADKIDILRANCDTPTEDVYSVTTQELKNACVSDDVKKAFREHRCARRREGMTPVDHLVGHVCFTFELVYRRSVELMFSQGYLFKLMEFKSDIPDTNEWFTYMRQEMLKAAAQFLRC